MPPKNNHDFHMQDGMPVYQGHAIKIPAHWRRILALLIDYLIIRMVFGSVLGGIWDGTEDIWLKWIICWIFTWLCFMLINGWPLVKQGQTLGKMFLKLRIVSVDIRPASWQRLLLLRYGVFLLYMVLPNICVLIFLFDSLFVFRPGRRSLHDLLAGTVVIQILEPVDPETTDEPPNSTIQ